MTSSPRPAPAHRIARIAIALATGAGVLALAAIQILRCTAPSGPSVATTSPAASVVPPMNEPARQLAELKSRIRELPEVRDRLAQDSEATLAIDPTSVAACANNHPCDGYVITVGGGPQDPSELVFAVDAKSGTISVDPDRHAHFDRGKRVPLSIWREETVARNAAALKVVNLPEVVGWQKGLEAAGLELAFWLDSPPPDKDCKAGESECQWNFYVGEAHPDHSVRRVSVSVDRASGEITVAGLNGVSVPYRKWRTTSSARLMRVGK